jgi:hypothetical protein
MKRQGEELPAGVSYTNAVEDAERGMLNVVRSQVAPL